MNLLKSNQKEKSQNQLLSEGMKEYGYQSITQTWTSERELEVSSSHREEAYHLSRKNNSEDRCKELKIPGLKNKGQQNITTL